MPSVKETEHSWRWGDPVLLRTNVPPDKQKGNLASPGQGEVFHVLVGLRRTLSGTLQGDLLPATHLWQGLPVLAAQADSHTLHFPHQGGLT